jgi:hypothetical protein
MQTEESLKDTVRRELPGWLRQDPDFRAWVLEITRESYASRSETRDWFHEILDELRRDREEQRAKWEEQNRKWEEENRKWQEQNHKWDEQNHQWEEQDRKWHRVQDEMGEEFRRVHEALAAQATKFDRTIGALGARLGIQSEQAFRNALAGILEQSFGVEVLSINEYDDKGTVFGRPEQIELDVIIKNGLLIICELKSSIDKAGMYSFERKARFYERRHQRQASRLIVISPMIDPRARPVAEKLGIECFSDSLNVETL